MASELAKRESALKLLDRLSKLDPDDESLQLHTRQLRAIVKTPMSAILAKVPGTTTKEKADRIGVSRQNYYCWLSGMYRPNAKQAKKLASLTGIPAEDIR